jgi:hypothetical protein
VGKTGGRVLLKRILTELMLVSNMELQIDSTAILLGIKSDKETDYPN